MQDRTRLADTGRNPETAWGMLALKTKLESRCWHEIECTVRTYLESPKEAVIPPEGA